MTTTEAHPPESAAPPGAAERALVIVPLLRESGEPARRDAAARADEAAGLAAAIDLDVAGAETVALASPRPGTLFGSGKVAEIASRVEADKIGLVIVDHPLTPVQQRNLERSWKAKVIDRTGLILEIFGERARTAEGRLQVELAHLSYQRSRLVRSWTHLERQRGGFGFLGGPGETQIEADRRALSERIERIKRDLVSVATRRRLQRSRRKRSAQPTVALVGYTNAGKSTLFNRLTRSAVFADDRLFATLDPTLRRVALPGGTNIFLSDTVGFVSDLPTSLVAAFRATLEEVVEADLILHVRDIAHPDSAAQAADVATVLSELDIDVTGTTSMIEVWNKIDLLPPGRRPHAPVGANAIDGPSATNVVAVSALTGEGIEDLLTLVEARVSAEKLVFQVQLRGEDLSRIHRLYALGEVIERHDDDDGTTAARVRVDSATVGRFREAFPGARPVRPQEDRAARRL